jgi:hypothetical protein
MRTELPFFLAMGLAVIACSSTKDSSSDGGATADASPVSDASASTSDAGGDAALGGALACYVADQFICDEYPDPTPAQISDVPVACSSRSGVLSSPPACPSAGFVGKCTIGAGQGIYVQRFYTGADAAYAQDFCVNTAMGTWSTTF